MEAAVHRRLHRCSHPLLTPAHETNVIITRQKTAEPINFRLGAVRFPEALSPITIAVTGSHIADGGKIPLIVSGGRYSFSWRCS